jgi:ribosome-associated protein
MALEINDHLSIPDEALEFKFVRSSGPGGQNVNKVSSAVQLRIKLDLCGLREDVRTRLEKLAGRRLNDAGEILLIAQASRAQERNREEALERFAELVRKALVAPKKRKATKPSRTAKKKRVDTKVKRGSAKKLRSRVSHDD